jgi:surface antigen
MKYLFKLGLVMAVLTFTLEAKNCWKIKNADTKALCESKYEHKKNCWLIKDSDTKAYCEATAYGQNSCWKIKNADDKEMCIAERGN